MVKKILYISAFILLSFKSSDKFYIGKASYYGKNWNGRITSSGEVFNRDSLTAAHKYIKFGTFVKVINLSNDSVIYVKINDRLPKSSNRLIDLSYGAAKKLNFIKKGITKVKIYLMK
jgi:rare lipoprotein A